MNTENRSLTIPWWLVKRKGIVHSPAIVAAENPEKIKESIPLFKENVEISALTWGDLASVLSIAIPTTKNFAEQVTGPITVKANKLFVVVIVT